MLNMRGLERQQLVMLELRSAATKIIRRTVSQGVLEGESFLQAAVKEVEASEARAKETAWRQTGRGWQFTIKNRR